MKILSIQEQLTILMVLKERFDVHPKRFSNLKWDDIETRLIENPKKLWSINEMERTGGEPNLLEYDKALDSYTFCDFSKESPKGRRSLCYDKKAWESRKKFKPEDTV